MRKRHDLVAVHSLAASAKPLRFVQRTLEIVPPSSSVWTWRATGLWVGATKPHAPTGPVAATRYTAASCLQLGRHVSHQDAQQPREQQEARGIINVAFQQNVSRATWPSRFDWQGMLSRYPSFSAHSKLYHSSSQPDVRLCASSPSRTPPAKDSSGLTDLAAELRLGGHAKPLRFVNRTVEIEPLFILTCEATVRGRDEAVCHSSPCF